jgi:hypothetical protein
MIQQITVVTSWLGLLKLFLEWAFVVVDIQYKKSRIRETPTLSTDAHSRTDTNLKRLHDLSNTKKIAVRKIWGESKFLCLWGGSFFV